MKCFSKPIRRCESSPSSMECFRMHIGFSTGSLALNNVRLALKMVAGKRTSAIELSALREEELAPLIDLLDSLDLRQFAYVSFHAPSRLTTLTETAVVELL